MFCTNCESTTVLTAADMFCSSRPAVTVIVSLAIPTCIVKFRLSASCTFNTKFDSTMVRNPSF